MGEKVPPSAAVLAAKAAYIEKLKGLVVKKRMLSNEKAANAYKILLRYVEDDYANLVRASDRVDQILLEYARGTGRLGPWDGEDPHGN